LPPDEHSRGASGTVRPGALSALLEEIAAAPPAGAPGPWETGLRAGAVIGRFELVRELGHGGFGVVWEATDRELGRRVAFKAVRAGARRELREERLLREAEAAARLAHPNIVTLYDVGRTEHGPYLVLELLEGRTLAARLAEGALPLAEALRVAAEIAQGLAHAHERGVVHRDLKPENVFLCRDGQVKVLDLGLAHAFGCRRFDGGTPAYMAPEQAEGSPEDERTDVWALGAILFEMLAGRPAFCDAGRRGKVPPLDVEGLPQIGAVVSRMLAPRPRDRPRDGGEALAVVTALRSASGAAAGPAGRVLARSWRRLAAGLVAVAAGALVVAALVARLGRPGNTTGGGRVVVAVADMVNETGERELDVLAGLLVTSLEQSRQLAVMTQTRVLDLAAQGGRRDLTRVDETLGRDVGRRHGVRALLLPAVRRLGTVYSVELRAIDPGRDAHLFTVSDRATSKEALLEVLDRISERTRLELGEAASEQAAARVQLGDAMTRSLEAYQRYASAIEAWNRDGLRAAALAELLEAVRLDPAFAAAHGQLASLYEVYGRPELAGPHWRAADENVGRMPEKERLLLELSRAVSLAAPEHRSPSDARRLAAALEARFPDDKHVLAWIADAYADADVRDVAGAERAVRGALRLDPGNCLAVVMLGYVLNDRPADLLENARRAVATRRSACNLSVLADAERATGSLARAAETAREALRTDGASNSRIVQRACEVLQGSERRPACSAEWRQLLDHGRNELERDFARYQLAVALAVQGRRREMLRLVAAVPEERRGVPFELARVLSVGLWPADASESRAAVRREPNKLLRRYLLTMYGAEAEADALNASLPAAERFEFAERLYEPLRLARQGRHAEAADAQRRARDQALATEGEWSASWMAYFLAEELLAAGRAEEAAAVEVRLPANESQSLLAYAGSGVRLALVRARALEQLGRSADALRVVDGVVAFWKDADHDLPLLSEARALRRRIAPVAKAGRSAQIPASAVGALPSIAVLPFADLSPNADQGYLADGVAEEILSSLAHVGGLKVVGRTSSFSFRGNRDDLRSIGRKLGADHLLEGSVRREGDRVRISAQLVKAADGYQLWAERYDRELTGALRVEDEIARAVVDALRVKLLPGAVLGSDAGRTASAEARDQYLLGAQLSRLGSRDGFRRAEQALRRAISVDPGYARAHAALAAALWGRYGAGDTASAAETESLQRDALAAAERAVTLAPGLAEAYQARGSMRRRILWDWAGAMEDLERALTLGQNDPEALWNLGMTAALLEDRGRRAIALTRRATELDPLSADAWRHLGFAYMAAGEAGPARQALLRAVQVAPEHDWARVFLAMSFLAEGDARSALATMERSATHGWKLWGRALAHHSLGNRAEARQALDDEVASSSHVAAYQIAEIYAWRGERDRAFEWLERCFRERDGGLVLAGRDPLLRGLHDDPRWSALLRRMNLPAD
jgi:serine/threonine protein kinase/TolB-like protein/Flp pilus assembly protein TadD